MARVESAMSGMDEVPRAEQHDPSIPTCHDRSQRHASSVVVSVSRVFSAKFDCPHD